MRQLHKKKPMNYKNSKKQNKKKIYTVAIIGTGRIASTFDMQGTKAVLTHAHAFSKHARTRLIGMANSVDTVSGKHEAHKWKTHFYADVQSILAQRPDIVVIATPDDTHAKLLEEVSLAKPKLIICEKPVGEDARTLKRLEGKVLPLKVPTLINFSRHFDPAVREVREALRKGKYGKVISASGIYTNGVLHNGPHLFDLAHFFFGKLKSIKGLSFVPDYSKSSPSVAGFATFERCSQFSIQTGDERAYAVFEFEIITEKKRIRFSNFGFELSFQDAVPDPLYKGFRALSRPVTLATGLSHALENLVTHAVEVLDKRQKLMSTLSEGIETQKTCLQLLASLT